MPSPVARYRRRERSTGVVCDRMASDTHDRVGVVPAHFSDDDVTPFLTQPTTRLGIGNGIMAAHRRAGDDYSLYDTEDSSFAESTYPAVDEHRRWRLFARLKDQDASVERLQRRHPPRDGELIHDLEAAAPGPALGDPVQDLDSGRIAPSLATK